METFMCDVLILCMKLLVNELTPNFQQACCRDKMECTSPELHERKVNIIRNKMMCFLRRKTFSRSF